MSEERHTQRLPREEWANVWTHVAGIVGSLAVAWPLMQLAIRHDWRYVLGTVLFLAGMLFMYGSSTLYHLMTPGSRAKRAVRVMDHISIFVMIAGSYSPICIGVLGGWLGWTLFAFLWACVLAGIVVKTIALGKSPRLSLALYLLMGWAAVWVIVPLWKAMPHAAFWCVMAEGVFYSVGSWFFSKDEEHEWFHAIWHVFILLGSLSHTAGLWLMMQ